MNADPHHEVVKSLTTKMNAWAVSLGAALTHQPAPAKLDAKPAPEADDGTVITGPTQKTFAVPLYRLLYFERQ